LLNTPKKNSLESLPKAALRPMTMTELPTTMRAAVTCGWNDIQLIDVPVPRLEAGEVMVRVRACGICGTDLKILDGVYAGQWPPKLPFIQGHEWGGTVVALGEGVTTLQVGDRVVAENHKGCGLCAMCRSGRYNLCEMANAKNSSHRLYGHTAQGAFAEYAARPVGLLHKIPDNISFEEGTIVNQASLGLHAIRRCRITPGDTVVVKGPGLVGLITLQMARISGAAKVIMVGRGPRLNLALELGADHVIDYSEANVIEEVRGLTDGRGADCVFECAGTARSVNSTPNAYPALIRLIAAGKINVKKLVSRVYPFDQIREAFDAFRRREDGAIRMVIQI
jgi:L-iditol 2-dehydrogenase